MNSQLRAAVYAGRPVMEAASMTEAARRRVEARAGGGSLLDRLLAQRAQAHDMGRAVRTHARQKSQNASFSEFCSSIDLDPAIFGALEANGGLSEEEEELALELYATFVVHNPRRKTATGKNTGRYAQSCVHAVRLMAWQNHRRHVCDPKVKHSSLYQTLKGLRKLAPLGKRAPRMPITQAALRAILETLDPRSQRDRVLRAYWLAQFQLVCRGGDLIRGKKLPAARSWDPLRETHRGRALFEPAVDETGRVCGVRLSLTLKPSKADPEGLKDIVKTGIIDNTPGALSAAAAIADMLEHAGEVAGALPEAISLFLDPTTGEELTYAYAAIQLRSRLIRSG
jgi:hypothetical protein